jgi:hypothetical protein
MHGIEGAAQPSPLISKARRCRCSFRPLLPGPSSPYPAGEPAFHCLLQERLSAEEIILAGKLEAPVIEITGFTSITLIVGGSFVRIGLSGVTIVGPMVKPN